MNRITNAERERLYAKAAALLQQDIDARAAEAHLQRSEGVSRDRARHAVAKARLRMNRPNG